MNKNEFDEKVLRRMNAWATSNDLVNDAGTRLIGHRPEIAPKAFLNVIYSALSETDIREFESRVQLSIPKQYRAFLGIANGLICYSGSLKVLGYIPKDRKHESHVHNYPSDAYIPNCSARLKGLRDKDFIVGFYKEDGSYALVNGEGLVERVSVKGDGKIIYQWENFDSWLSEEILRLDELFRSKMLTS
ncbi:SMI1/KNR4 family protein [Rheinheimera nanhaiensis]|uniref:SMI1/KNR4 family protein n=1 Tax=Rheinheimera nanhaiensis TaxID=1163621 RepID=UPI00192B1B5D|nr:SMI1/KNR4 family protein [Rheinheimera nanhaiensis]